MKNNFIKYYIIAVYLCSTFVMFAQPGDTGDGLDGLEGGDAAPAASIDDYVIVLAAIGLFFVFFRFKALVQQQNEPKE